MGFLYDSSTEDVYVPAAHLEFPHFIESLPLWALFGPFGYILGHELMHAFEMAGKKHFRDLGPEYPWLHMHWYTKTYEVRSRSGWTTPAFFRRAPHCLLHDLRLKHSPELPLTELSLAANLEMLQKPLPDTLEREQTGPVL